MLSAVSCAPPGILYARLTRSLVIPHCYRVSHVVEPLLLAYMYQALQVTRDHNSGHFRDRT